MQVPTAIKLVIATGLCTWGLSACKKSEPTDAGSGAQEHSDAQDHDHSTGDAAHDDHGHEHADDESHDDHGEEIALGSTTIGDSTVECWQGHGTVAAGKELHLVVKLPYNDSGATIVRAWIGTEDRLASMVALGQYAPSHDDYDIHAVAPDPLPADAKWWIEIEKPDGTKSVGSIDLR